MKIQEIFEENYRLTISKRLVDSLIIVCGGLSVPLFCWVITFTVSEITGNPGLTFILKNSWVLILASVLLIPLGFARVALANKIKIIDIEMEKFEKITNKL